MNGIWHKRPGLTRGTGDYVASAQIASGYDQFLEGDGLAAFDEAVLQQVFPSTANAEPETVIDLGCGTGRSLFPLMMRGYSVIGVDLSRHMLRSFRQKTTGEFAHTSLLIRANLVELDGLAENIADHGICMFSTLGMIKGRANRQKFLQHVSRIIKPSGRFVVHAHNFWHQTGARGGLAFFAGNLFDAARGKSELGDRYADYRGIRGMFIHSFRATELERLLTANGFSIDEWYRVPEIGVIPAFSTTRDRFDFRSTGWIVVCTNG